MLNNNDNSYNINIKKEISGSKLTSVVDKDHQPDVTWIVLELIIRRGGAGVANLRNFYSRHFFLGVGGSSVHVISSGAEFS